MNKECIVIASDHGGFEMKNSIKKELFALGYDVLDVGTNNTESVDYPDYANALADKIKSGHAKTGILICGTGIGISIAANRHAHIRAALVHDALSARLTRQHNDANILVFGAMKVTRGKAVDILTAWLKTRALKGRHAKRVRQIVYIEKKVFKKL